MSELKIGQTVRIVPLGKTGRIREIKDARYCTVEVAGLPVKCKMADLRALETPERAKSPKSKSPTQTLAPSRKRQIGKRVLDLHGLNREQAVREVEQFLSDAIVDGLPEVDIIHGHGTGALKFSLHEYLSGLSVVSHFGLSPTNSGVTRVVLS